MKSNTIIKLLAVFGISIAVTSCASKADICGGFDPIFHAPMTDDAGDLVDGEDPSNAFDTPGTVRQVDKHNASYDRICE